MKSFTSFLFLLCFSFFTHANHAPKKDYLTEGLKYLKKQNFTSAKELLNKAKITLLLENKFEEAARATISLAQVYLILDNKDSCLLNLLENRKLILSNLGKENELLAICDDKTGEVYMEYGDADEAKRYYDESLFIRVKILGENDCRTAVSYSNIGSYHAWHPGTGQDSALYFGKKALNICYNYPEHINEIALEKIYIDYAFEFKIGTRNGPGKFGFEQRFDTTLMYLDTALHIIKKKYGIGSYMEALVLHLKGNCFNDACQLYPSSSIKGKQAFLKAIDYYESDLIIRKKHFGDHHSSIAISYYTLALLHEFYFKSMGPPQCLININHSIEALLPKFKFARAENVPNADSCVNTYLLNVLMERRMFYLEARYATHPSLETLKSIHGNNQLRIKLWFQLMATLKSQEASQVQAIWIHGLFENVSHTAYELFRVTNDSIYLAEIYSYAEKSKNIELIKSFIFSSDSPQDLGMDKVISIDSLQLSLRENEAIIEYLMRVDNSTKNNFVIVITKKQFHILPFPFDDELSGTISEFINSMNNLSAKSFCEKSHKLTKSILTPVLQVLPASITSLNIIPDKNISLIPFDVLVLDTSASSSFHSLNYLNKRFVISYSLGNTIKEVMKKLPLNSSGMVAGFAPSFSSLSGLPFSKQFISDLSGKFSGTYFFNEKASIQNYVSAAENHSVIQLATHAIADLSRPELSKIYFSNDQYLTIDSIGRIKINAALVVASACETAIGKEMYAEGMKSFARAFTYAGSKSTITTLWKVDDKATSSILASFYKYLLQGYAKDQALQKAKLDYLNFSSEEESNPFYWSGLILTNDTSPIQLKKKTPQGLFLCIGLSVLIVFAIGVYQFKRRI